MILQQISYAIVIMQIRTWHIVNSAYQTWLSKTYWISVLSAKKIFQKELFIIIRSWMARLRSINTIATTIAIIKKRALQMMIAIRKVRLKSYNMIIARLMKWANNYHSIVQIKKWLRSSAKNPLRWVLQIHNLQTIMYSLVKSM